MCKHRVNVKIQIKTRFTIGVLQLYIVYKLRLRSTTVSKQVFVLRNGMYSRYNIIKLRVYSPGLNGYNEKVDQRSTFE